MRRATENHRNTNSRTLSDCFLQRNKVKDILFQQYPRKSFPPDTPMKPSQLPNQLSSPPPRRILPLESPELYHRARLDLPWHPPHPPGPSPSSGFVPSSPTYNGSPGSRWHPMSRARLGPHQHHQPQGPQPSSPSVFHPAPPQFMKDLSNHSPSSHTRRDQGTESRVTMSYSGSKNVTAQRQDSNKDQSSDVRSSTHSTQLHGSPMSPSFFTRAVQEVCTFPLSDEGSPGNSQQPSRGYQPSPSIQSSDRNSGSSLPINHSSLTPSMDQQHKRMPSSENSIPDSTCSSQKRHRESEDCDDNPKKPCLLGINSDKVQTTKPSVCNSLSVSLLSQPSARHPSVLEQSPKTTDGHPGTEPACGQSTHSELSSTFKPTQSSCASLSPKPCIKKRPPMGVKLAYIYSSPNHPLQLVVLGSPVKNPGQNKRRLKKRSEDSDKKDKSGTLLSSAAPQKDSVSSSHGPLGSHHSAQTHRSTSVLPVKTPSRGDHTEESKKSDSGTHKPASKTSSGSPSCRTVERNKTHHPRRPVVVLNDIDELFTPDPLTYVVNHKLGKPKMNWIKSPTSEKSCSPSTGTSSSTPVTGSSCCKSASPHSVDTKSSSLPQTPVPTLALPRVKLENSKSASSKDGELKNSPVTSSGRQLKDESVKSDEKRTSGVPNDERPCTLETTSHCSRPPLPERRASEGHGKPETEEDPIDVELDLGLSFALDLDITQSSQSSEEERLLSLQEMMAHVAMPPDTPEKGAFSEPSTPGHSSQSKSLQPLPPTTKLGTYKNNLDQMLKEINTNKRVKEIETQLLTACKEDLLRIAEYEEPEENREEGVSTEQQQFLQRYSLMSNVIREVPPGEEVFNLEKFGRFFDQDMLQLRGCMVNPQGTAQKTLLWSSPAQLRLHVTIGLFQEAYCCSPCPTQVTRFLFKMMSVHNERMVSEKILQALCDIACSAACQIVKNGSQQFQVWTPSLADVALVLMNMGAAFVSLFPFENLQPPFTEGDLLEDICIKSESPSSNKEQSAFPEHNCNNILKYLSYCMGLCPRAYNDDELLLLLTVVGKVGLDSRLIPPSSVELYSLQYTLINNIRDWDTMLPRICRALTDLTDDHHNMCLLVQLLPDSTRGKQLRRHLSLSMISKLLDGSCTYRPTETEFQLSELRPYLPRMQPSTLLRGMLSSSSRKDKDEDTATADQQSYYLCYSLLTLVNEASNFQFFPAHQKKQLLFLCSELETHVKCDIRESEKCLYRSKVKDLVARIYTKWQMLLQRTRPLHGKLYDYWQPLPTDTVTGSQEEQETDTREDGDGSATVDEEEDSDEGVLIIDEDEEKDEGDETIKDTNKTEDDMKPEEMKGDSAMEDTRETEESPETVDGESKRVHTEQAEAENTEHTEVETENVAETRETSHNNDVI